MASVTTNLVDEKLGIIRLFTPPFNKTSKDPGYIKGYPPGVRENGGQYTHAATWVVPRYAELGTATKPIAAFRCSIRSSMRWTRRRPITIGSSPMSWRPISMERASKGGRGGWTWYTGSAGWIYRAAVEDILGIRRQGDRILVNPTIPSDWAGYTATLRFGETKYRIRVERNGKGKAI